MRCLNCHAEYGEADQFCRQCGTELTEPSTSIVPTQSALPAVLYNPQVPRGVAASVGALALGVGIELLRRTLIARLTRPSRAAEHALPALSGMKDLITPSPSKPPKGYEIQETVVYMRRVIRRAN